MIWGTFIYAFWLLWGGFASGIFQGVGGVGVGFTLYFGNFVVLGRTMIMIMTSWYPVAARLSSCHLSYMLNSLV
jgi:hypothetical protein